MFVTLMLIFEISRASFLISCFSLKISCEIKISWQHAAMLADFLMPCKYVCMCQARLRLTLGLIYVQIIGEMSSCNGRSLIKINILGVVTAELKEDYEGKPSLMIHPNGPMHFVSDDLSMDLSESDGKQTYA
jgi:hypothetical protein